MTASKVFELVKAFDDAVVDLKLAKELGDKARMRAIVGGNAALLLDEEEIVGSKILEAVYASRCHLLSSSGISHVLYAPSSTGKTSALMYFMKQYLETYNTPAIMISGQFPGEVDYLTCMAGALEIPLHENKSYSADISWIKCLLDGLMPREGEILEHAPVLILDEFNSPGRNRENILFAESFARFVYGKKITVIFATQNEGVARDICMCDAWQKVGPLPGMTTPDRISDPLPPTTYEWKDMKWSQLKLTQMIQSRSKYKGHFNNELDKEGHLIWLKGITNTTTALLAADERLASKIPVKTGAIKYKDGFFKH